MRIKKFEGETLQDALSKVKKDFGSEAVILHTKKYRRGGVFGVFGKEITEVTAGIDINVEPRQEKQVLTMPQPPKQQYAKPAETQNISVKPTYLETYRKNQAQALEIMANIKTPDELLTVKNDTLLRELNEGRVSLGSQARISRDITSSVAGTVLKTGLARIQKQLIDNGVEESIVFRILQNINSSLSDAQIGNKQFMDNYLFDYIANMIQVSGPVTINPGITKIIALIGATGVGKTTTLAKLAAKFALLEGKRVVMVSADTYRIAAEAQLKKYGDIMGIPVEIVLTPQDFKKVINKHMDKDIILFDTAGRSPRNKKHLMELKEFLDVHSPIETHIVISAVTKYYDALSIINNFGMVPIHRILFTKLDETKNYGILLNLSVGSGGIPLSYITTGQTVPDDMETADQATITRLVLKGDFETWIRQKN